MTTWFSLILKTSFRLGPRSIARVMSYRLACRSGLYRLCLPQRPWISGEQFFPPGPCRTSSLSEAQSRIVLETASRLLGGELSYYSCTWKKNGAPPDWLLDPFSGTTFDSQKHWSDCGELSGCDIKNVWEASRFEWVPVLALAWRVSGTEKFLRALNDWLFAWVQSNPPNSGPNWKCGQEASIRLINLLLGARLLCVHNEPAPALVELIALHCSRISPTIRYAVAQDNNHGTSEAAALFIGGGWLRRIATTSLKSRAARWHAQGRHWLEDRVRSLVASDGSFSQYSVNYHRVLLDTLCQVEIWRREFNAAPFSDLYAARCKAAASWLEAMTDAETGDTPNMGANDGARLYDVFFAPYRDFRPSVLLASLLFQGSDPYCSREWHGSIEMLGVDSAPCAAAKDKTSRLFNDGGYVLLCSGSSRGVLRFARFNFRPGHADCLHLDLWYKGRSILRDGGTFSYNADAFWHDYFSGTQSHNTVQFDGRNQMPRIGRFLLGNWLKMESCSEIANLGNTASWSGTYSDWKGARHCRSVSVEGNIWRIRDEISGFKEKAVLRWRLAPAKWELTDGRCSSEMAQLAVITSAPLRRLELVDGWESLHYQQKTALPVLEVEVGPGSWTINTEILLKD